MARFDFLLIMTNSLLTALFVSHHLISNVEGDIGEGGV